MPHYLPVCLNLEGRAVVLLGGGAVATERFEQLLRCGARLRVISPDASLPIRRAAAEGLLTLELRPYRQGDCSGAYLVAIATNDPEVNLQAYQEASEEGALVNVCDDPDHCNYIFAARVERGPLTISIFTHGSSPALSARVRREMETQFGVEYGLLADLLMRRRPEVQAIPDRTVAERKAFWEEAVNGPLLQLLRRGDQAGAENWMQEHLNRFIQPDLSETS